MHSDQDMANAYAAENQKLRQEIERLTRELMSERRLVAAGERELTTLRNLAEAVKAWRKWDGEADNAADYRAKLNDLQYAIDAALAATKGTA